MEVVQEYRRFSTEGFRFEPCWIDVNNESDLTTYLHTLQKNTRPQKATITTRDVKFILSKLKEIDSDPQDIIIKLVIQKGNTEVSNDTRRLGGIWANLIYLLRVYENDECKWKVYGGGKGRYRKYPLLEIDSGKPLGYSYFLSVSQNDKSKAQHFNPLDAIRHHLNK